MANKLTFTDDEWTQLSIVSQELRQNEEARVRLELIFEGILSKAARVRDIKLSEYEVDPESKSFRVREVSSPKPVLVEAASQES